MKNKKLLAFFGIVFFLLALAFPALAAQKAKLTKAVITEVSGTTITATKNSKTYTINAEGAVLRNAKGKRATIDQFLANDQIDVSGTRGSDGIIVARTVKNRSIKATDLTRGSVGAENLKDDAISDLNFISNGIITEDKLQVGTLTNVSIADNANISASKLNLTNAIATGDIQDGAITGEKLADGITIPTGNFTTLDLGTNTVTDGNFNGNWSFNSGNLSNVGNVTGEAYNGNTLTTGTGTLTLNSYAFALSGNSQINQNLLSTSSPIFAGMTLSSPLTTANGGTGANTFSSNYLLKGNGTGAIQSSIIYDNGTNVGIGTTSPSDLLSLYGSYPKIYLFDTNHPTTHGPWHIQNITANDTDQDSMFGINYNQSGFGNAARDVDNQPAATFTIEPLYKYEGDTIGTSEFHWQAAAPGTGAPAYSRPFGMYWSFDTSTGHMDLYQSTARFTTGRNWIEGSGGVRPYIVGLSTGLTFDNPTSGSTNIDFNGGTTYTFQSDYFSQTANNRTYFVQVHPSLNQVQLGTSTNHALWLATNNTNRLVLDTSGNLILGLQGSAGTSAAKVLAIQSGTAPTTSPADMIQMWSADTAGVAGDAGLHIRTENGTTHVLGSNVGIGTTNPQSKLQVDGGYIQLDNNSGAPASADCDAAAEEGRIYWDATGDELYVCSGTSGWRKMTTVAP